MSGAVSETVPPTSPAEGSELAVALLTRSYRLLQALERYGVEESEYDEMACLSAEIRAAYPEVAELDALAAEIGADREGA